MQSIQARSSNTHSARLSYFNPSIFRQRICMAYQNSRKKIMHLASRLALKETPWRFASILSISRQRKNSPVTAATTFNSINQNIYFFNCMHAVRRENSISIYSSRHYSSPCMDLPSMPSTLSMLWLIAHLYVLTAIASKLSLKLVGLTATTQAAPTRSKSPPICR